MRLKIVLSILTLLSTICLIDGWATVEDPREDPSLYNIGIGIHDATGPAAGVNMMGYAKASQINNGIHFRLYSRAFILDDGIRRSLFVNVDCGMMAQIIKIKIVERLQETYGAVYDYDNVMLSGTHTHSGPAGFLQYLLFDITSLGFIHETFDAMVEGIYQSIVMAHDSMTPGYVFVSQGELANASINRSPSAYDNNPEEEKAKYNANTDNIMTVLRFVDIDGVDLGMLNWFAVHATSMNNTNTLISGDNKGYASMRFEQEMNPGALPGKGPFVAAFSQANCGDISPNTDGPKCRDTGEPCDVLTSTCGGRSQMCFALGPGKDMTESTKIIGGKQFEKALELFNDPSAVKLSGPVQYIGQFIDMSAYDVTLPNGTVATTCTPAIGYSFAAGTIDGVGAFDFTQGMTSSNPFWDSVVDTIQPTKPEQIICHAPKPVLLDTGNYNKPYPWHPRIMETQISRWGQLLILPVPGEFTTMAGRRLKDKMVATAEANGLLNTIPVVAGLSNVYSHYITTNEEYAIQRYEGASTIFGPHTLQAYLQQYSFLLNTMASGNLIPTGPLPPNLLDQVITVLPGVIYDMAETDKLFGNVVAQPYPISYVGETVIAVFVSGHPRNTVALGGTFLTVEHKVNDTLWEIIATDASWETRFMWERTSVLLGSSEVSVYWDVPLEAKEGTYRISHFGHHKSFRTGRVEAYQGTTEPFKVVKPIEKKERTEWLPAVQRGSFSWFASYFHG